MKNNEEIKEELQRQIRFTGMHLDYKPTTQDAQKLIDMLGGDAKVEMGNSIESVCYYITLLLLEKQI